MPNSESPWILWLPPFLRQKIEGRPKFQTILENTGWLIFDRLLRMTVGVTVGIWIARYLGPSRFGILNYAISFAAIFGAIAPLGLDSIVVRDLIRDKGEKDRLLGTALVLRLISGALVFVAACAAAYLTAKHDPEASGLIVWIALSYIAQSFDIIDYWFQANLTSRLGVIAKSIAFLLVTALKVAALLTGMPLIVFAILTMAEIALSSLSLLAAYRLGGNRMRLWTFDKALALRLLKDGWALTLASVTVLIYMKIDQVLLGNMAAPSAVGFYAAAVRLVEVWYFVPGALIVSIAPSIVKARQENPDLYQARLQQLYDLMALISVGIALFITVFSRSIVTLLYGDAYREAAGVVTIYIWSGIPTFLGVASSQFLVTENLARISLYRTAIGMVLNIALNLILIPQYGIMGSAVATLISYSAATFSVVLFKASRHQATMMLKSLFVFRGIRNISTM